MLNLNNYLDYPLSFIVDSCIIIKKNSPEKEGAEKILEGRKKVLHLYELCDGFNNYS